ncbi:MBL fold metallo-hydrolase [Ornithinibacillus xuwenensis]|uniref:MBL fold metallo-hydrolase n=1 Tax=Ornithinibacillus xuwenensis TaxID=3144668 RepID=A0ABU9XGM6_9BACI
MSNVILSIIGTAQDGGIPHPNCFCENCRLAMQDQDFKRLAASIAIIIPDEGAWHLIDATPDIKEQLRLLQLKYHLAGEMMRSIFLTHAHMGHLPGLLFLGKEAINTKSIPVYAGTQIKKLLLEQAPWKQLHNDENIVVREIHHKESVKLSKSLSIKPLLVPHRNEFSETFGYWIDGPTKSVLYIPDIDRWKDWNLDIVSLAKEADICLLDGTFYSPKDLEKIGRDLQDIPHPPITETMDLLQEVASKTKIIFTHLNHSNPVIHPDGASKKQIESRGFFIAEERQEICI